MTILLAGNDMNKKLDHVRSGFTAVEMIVVVSIVILLVSMVVPTIGPAIKKGQVHDAANAIQRACSMARQLARSNSGSVGASSSNTKHFGVAIVVPDASGAAKNPAYAAVVYFDGALNDYSNANSPGNQYPNGLPDYTGTPHPTTGEYPVVSNKKPAAKFVFNRGVLPFMEPVATRNSLNYELMEPGTSIGWYYQYRTGFIIPNISSPTETKDIGVIPSSASTSTAASPQSLGVASVDLRYKSAIAIYRIGLINIQDMQ
jgi:type II secretory pathway pseudopilin PulG